MKTSETKTKEKKANDNIFAVPFFKEYFLHESINIISKSALNTKKNMLLETGIFNLLNKNAMVKGEKKANEKFANPRFKKKEIKDLFVITNLNFFKNEISCLHSSFTSGIQKSVYA